MDQFNLDALVICGDELCPEVADDPWVCVRAPHESSEAHQDLDGSTWRTSWWQLLEDDKTRPKLGDMPE